MTADMVVVGSYSVLFVSLAAHAAQFAFLLWFENPRELGPTYYLVPQLNIRYREDLRWRQETIGFPCPVDMGTRSFVDRLSIWGNEDRRGC